MTSFLNRSRIFLAAILAAVVGVPVMAQRPARAAAPCTATAFSPDGRLLAIGAYRRVTLVNASTGKPVAELPGATGTVTNVAFDPAGKRLAAGGGVLGKGGEIQVWDLATRKAKRLTGAHSDAIYGMAWSPDGKRLAAGSYDRLVSLWDVAAGTFRKLKDHTDSVYGVAFSPDGRRIASVSADRTVKIWDAESGKRLYTMSDATAELYAVAFAPSGSEVAAGGADKMLRKWTLGETSGTLLRSAFAHDGLVLRILYTPDGRGLVTSSEDRSVKLWDSTTLVEQRVLEKQADWPLGLALSPDGQRIAVGRYDGSAAVYEAESGRREFTTEAQSHGEEKAKKREGRS